MDACERSPFQASPDDATPTWSRRTRCWCARPCACGASATTWQSILRPDHWWGALLATGGRHSRAGRQPDARNAGPADPRAAAQTRRSTPPSRRSKLARLALQAIGAPAPSRQPRRISFTHQRRRAGHRREHHLADPRSRRQARRRHPPQRRRAAQELARRPAGRPWPIAWLICGVAVLLVGAPDDSPLLAAIQSHMAQPPSVVRVRPVAGALGSDLRALRPGRRTRQRRGAPGRGRRHADRAPVRSGRGRRVRSVADQARPAGARRPTLWRASRAATSSRRRAAPPACRRACSRCGVDDVLKAVRAPAARFAVIRIG